jgi:hypothetical protein
MKKITLQSVAFAARVFPKAFANTNSASKFYISSTPQNNDLNQAGYEALTWVEIKSFGSRGETGRATNILTYDTWDRTVFEKSKGMTDAGSPDIEVARIPNDPGQILLRAAGAITNNNNYAFRESRSDGTTAINGTQRYNRGLVVGPKSPGGRNEDFDLENYTLGLVQEEIVVNPLASGNAPAFTAAPAITGTATVGQVLTLSNGTVTGDAVITYERQWLAGGVPIEGATNNTFLLTSAQVGRIITGRVVARNASGWATANSPATAAVT